MSITFYSNENRTTRTNVDKKIKSLSNRTNLFPKTRTFGYKKEHHVKTSLISWGELKTI